MNESVKIKSKSGHEALVLVESLPAYEAAGWHSVKDVTPPDPDTQGEPQPNPSPLVAQLPDKSEKK